RRARAELYCAIRSRNSCRAASMRASGLLSSMPLMNRPTKPLKSLPIRAKKAMVDLPPSGLDRKNYIVPRPESQRLLRRLLRIHRYNRAVQEIAERPGHVLLARQLLPLPLPPPFLVRRRLLQQARAFLLQAPHLLLELAHLALARDGPVVHL